MTEGDLPIEIKSIGLVRSTRAQVIDDLWDLETSSIVLDDTRFSPDALLGLEEYSHVEILFYMHLVSEVEIESGARYPRGNLNFGKVGIFAQRGKGRPNKIGSTICKVLAIKGLELKLQGLDALDGTPVLDIKPWVMEFGPRGPVRQPPWVSELMKVYWHA